MSEVNPFASRPTDPARVESPLQGLPPRPLTPDHADSGVTLHECALLGHLIVRGDARDTRFVSGIEQTLNLPLPGPLALSLDGQRSLQWLGPDEWLLIVPGGEEANVESNLRRALSGLHIAVVNVSGGQTLLELSGPCAHQVLMKSTSYDVHPRNFPVGKAVGSVFAKSQCVIRHIAEHRWQLVVRRSFAGYFLRWLLDAGAEYGVRRLVH